MNFSTFYSDGYNDGMAGKHASPPAPYSFAGHTTNVFAAEYLQGWVDGRNSPASVKNNPEEKTK